MRKSSIFFSVAVAAVVATGFGFSYDGEAAVGSVPAAESAKAAGSAKAVKGEVLGGARVRRYFDEGWLFTKARQGEELQDPALDDNGWRRLNLPHDWAIEGDFSAENPSGASGGALPGGIGWYRKHFTLDLAKDQVALIDFDGVYMNSTVWINGHELGFRPYGFISFQYELTPYLRNGDNVIAVKVDNQKEPNSRWYSGCGIYRHVWLTTTGKVRAAQWGVLVTTDPEDGSVKVSVTLAGEEKQNVSFRNTVYDADGRIVATRQSKDAEQTLKVKNPLLWSTDEPNTYVVKTEILAGKKVTDELETRTSFRSFRFDPETGFWLDGVNMKINGVCDHHDLGCLGAAVNNDAIRRQLVKLRDMGVNAIRTSHYPPAPELLDMCDTMGFMVMDEAFDQWYLRKTEYDYGNYFKDWHERDLRDFVLRDRNHPSVIMWSIGNEVREQNEEATDTTLQGGILNLGNNNAVDKGKRGGDKVSSSTLVTEELASIVKSLDPTRPVTSGCNHVNPKTNYLFMTDALDVIGLNYHLPAIKTFPENFPGKPLVMSETVSSIQARGFYEMPSDSVYIRPESYKRMNDNPSHLVSSYDNSRVPWGSTHEECWDAVKNTPYCSGQFIWTGWDYIGEPTPYTFPSRSSYFGIIDLAGFPKDVYYMYKSEWTEGPVLHLFPHWNWMPGQEVDLWCYYNDADEVELFVNGVSQGVRSKGDHEYHVSWRVVYEPGEVEAVARKDGKEVMSQTIRTAGPASKIRLDVDYAGDELTFVNVTVTDEFGNLCPWAENQIFFSTSAADGSEAPVIEGVDNGSEFSMERFKDNKRKAFFGKCMVVLRGHGTLSAKAYDLAPASLDF